MARDTRTLKATPVEEYRRKIGLFARSHGSGIGLIFVSFFFAGHHDKKVVQKDAKHQKQKQDNQRNFGQSVKVRN